MTALVCSALSATGTAFANDVDGCYKYLKPDDAIPVCTKIIKDGTYNRMSNIYSARGVAYSFSKKMYDRAIQDFNKAIQLDSKNSIAYGQRGIAYSAKGNHAQALADLQTAVALDPNNQTAITELKKLRAR